MEKDRFALCKNIQGSALASFLLVASACGAGAEMQSKKLDMPVPTPQTVTELPYSQSTSPKYPSSTIYIDKLTPEFFNALTSQAYILKKILSETLTTTQYNTIHPVNAGDSARPFFDWLPIFSTNSSVNAYTVLGKNSMASHTYTADSDGYTIHLDSLKVGPDAVTSQILPDNTVAVSIDTYYYNVADRHIFSKIPEQYIFSLSAFDASSNTRNIKRTLQNKEEALGYLKSFIKDVPQNSDWKETKSTTSGKYNVNQGRLVNGKEYKGSITTYSTTVEVAGYRKIYSVNSLGDIQCQTLKTP